MLWAVDLQPGTGGPETREAVGLGRQHADERGVDLALRSGGKTRHRAAPERGRRPDGVALRKTGIAGSPAPRAMASSPSNQERSAKAMGTLDRVGTATSATP